MKSRQHSIKEFSLQIKIGLLVEKDGRNYKIDREKLKELINANRDYFKAVSEGEKEFKFRDHSLKSKKVMSLLMHEIKILREEISQENLN